MKLLLPYFIILIVVIQLKLHKKNNKNSISDFLDRETKANSTRKKDISNLNYITIPDSLPLINTEDSNILRAYDVINSMRNRKIVNLSGMSNTDIKFEYGVANLPVLTEYDDNFTTLVRALNTAGTGLIKAGHAKEGCEILEYAILNGSDIKATYVALADYYQSVNNREGLDKLLMYANAIQSPSGARIKDYLKLLY